MTMAQNFNETRLLKTLFVAAALGFTPFVAAADDLSVVFVQDSRNRTSELSLSSSYETVAKELERTLLLQNIYVLNVETAVPSSLPSKMVLFKDQKFAEQDYGVVYEISPEISDTNIARLLSVVASGDIYEIKSGRLVTSFRVEAPEIVPLPKDEAACSNSCVENKIASLADDLVRELSFVLTQKLHFLREDQGRVDTTDSAAIEKRLTAHEDQPQLLEKITSSGNDYNVDKARAVDVDVYFDFDSAALTVTAETQLNPLGEALASPTLRQSRYLVAGHTDAKGSAEYNRRLSERRAKTVRQYLLQQFAIEPDRLVAVGLGEDHLRTPLEPNAAINRRVEIAAIVEGQKAETPTLVAWDYTLTFDLLPRDTVLKAVRQLEVSNVDKIELLKSSTTQRIYSVRTDMALINFEELVMLALMDQGLDLDRLRFSSSGTRLSVETLN